MSEANTIHTKQSALSPTIPTADDATVIRLCDEILAGFAEADRLSGDEGQYLDANLTAVYAINAAGRVARAEAAAIRAVTLKGWQAKASVLVASVFGQDDELALSLADDLLAASA